MKRALFLDRDGIVNVDKRHMYKIDDCEFVTGIFELCKKAAKNQYMILVVTNQAGIAKGYYDIEDANLLHEHIKNTFANEGITIEDIYVCPHHPEFTGPCSCRKPEPGMILQASKEHNLDLRNSIIIGDKISDADAGRNAGIETCLVLKGLYSVTDQAEYPVFNELGEIVEYLINIGRFTK